MKKEFADEYKQRNPVVRCGYVEVKESGNGACGWMWKIRWAALTEGALTLQASETSTSSLTHLPLQTLTKVDRVLIKPKPFCLLLEARGKQFYVALRTDRELYEWRDDIYLRSGLAGGDPYRFVHRTHVGYDEVSGGLTGLPREWSTLLQRTRPCVLTEPQPQLRSRRMDQGRWDSYTYTTSMVSECATVMDGSKVNSMARFSIGDSIEEEKESAKVGSLWWGSGKAERKGKAEREVVLLGGRMKMREPGSCARWLWGVRCVVLTATKLSVSRGMHGDGKGGLQIYLHDIISVNRVDAKLYCLFIETKSQKKVYIAFKSDEELYTWQDAIYSHSVMSGISSPRNFVHRVHVGFDPVSGQFTGLPLQWSKVLGIQGQGVLPIERSAEVPVRMYQARQDEGEIEREIAELKRRRRRIQTRVDAPVSVSSTNSGLTLVDEDM